MTTRYFITKALHILTVLLLVSFAVTALADLIPGSPALSILGENATDEQIAAFNVKHGFDLSLIPRYFSWLGAALGGDLGTSIRMSEPVLAVIGQRLPVTLEIALLSILITAVVSIPLALYAADHAGGIVDRAANALSSAFVSMPGFVIAIGLVALFAVTLGISPVAGWVPIERNLADNLRYAALPAVALALVEIPILYRVLRADTLSTLNQEFIQAARARGLTRTYVLARHVLRPSSFSLITMLGLAIGRLLGGTVIVEIIFALPGIGSLAVQSIYAKDIVVVQGVVVVVAAAYVIINALIDLAYTALDPRVSTS